MSFFNFDFNIEFDFNADIDVVQCFKFFSKSPRVRFIFLIFFQPLKIYSAKKNIFQIVP
jgi:hypothetical protein